MMELKMKKKMDVLDKILVFDPEKRARCEELLEHEYFRDVKED